MKHLLIFLLFPFFLNAQSLVQVAHANGPVYAIAKHGNMTVIGGKFTTVNGVFAQNIAWSTDQITWYGIGGGINDTVKDIAYYNGDFFICGSFTQADTGANKFIVRWSPITHRFKSIKNNQNYSISGFGGSKGISSLTVVDTILYACGRNWQAFFQSNGYKSLYRYVPSIDTQFVSVPAWYNLFNGGSVTSADLITSSGHQLYIRSLYGNTPSIYVLNNNAATTFNLSYSYCISGSVNTNSLGVLNDTVYASYPTGVVRNGANYCMVAFDTIPTFSLLRDTSKLYMGGRSVYTTTGAGYTSAFTTNGIVYRMMYDTVMYFAGTFDSINGHVFGNVVKYQNPVHALASYDSAICAGGSVTFTNLTTGTNPVVSWSFTGGSPSTSTANIQTVQFNTSGNHQVRLIASNSTSIDTAYFNIYVDVPTNFAGPSQITYCANQTDTVSITARPGAFLSWSPNNGVTQNFYQFIFNPSSASRYTFYATTVGCADSITVNVSKGTPITLAAPSQISYCTGSADTINVSGFSGSFTWSPHTNISNTGSSFNIFAPSSTAYTIYASSGGCSDSIIVNVTVNALPPTPTITQIDSELQSSAATGNQWYYSGSVLNGSINQILTLNQNGAYSVMVTDANGCRSSLSQAYNYTKPVDSVSTGIDDLGGDEVILYPNPVTTIVHLKGAFDLIASDGRIIGSYKDEADLNGLPSGIYLAVGKNFRKKIIKQ